MTDSDNDTPGTCAVSSTAWALVWLSTLALPGPAVRERYRIEHHGELSALTATQQLRYAVGTLCTAPAVRRAVTTQHVRPLTGDTMKYLLVVLAIAIGIAAVVAGGIDDSPGGQLIGVLLVVGAIVFGVRVARRSQ